MVLCLRIAKHIKEKPRVRFEFFPDLLVGLEEEGSQEGVIL